MTHEEAKTALTALATERMEGLRIWCRTMSAQLDAPQAGRYAMLPYQGMTTPATSLSTYTAAVRRVQVMLNSRDKKLADRALAIVEGTGVIPVQ